MIVIDLECEHGHSFEGWFDNLDAFDVQREKGLVRCPYCDDVQVKRVMSAVALKKSAPKPIKSPGEIDYKRLAMEVVDYIQKNSEDVGPKFTAEALKMHFGVTEKRSIRGSATEAEEKTLRDEGIEFIKIPLPKTDPLKKN
jgi:hypothetical protein